jgi:hypothetical protein
MLIKVALCRRWSVLHPNGIIGKSTESRSEAVSVTWPKCRGAMVLILSRPNATAIEFPALK